METKPSPAVNLAPKVSAGIVSTPALQPGWKSTEFWIAILIIVLDVLGAMAGIIPAEYAAKLATITGLGYKLLRVALKWRQSAGLLQSVLEVVELPATAGAEPEMPFCPGCHSNLRVRRGAPNGMGGDNVFVCGSGRQGCGLFEPDPAFFGNPIVRGSQAGCAAPGLLGAVAMLALAAVLAGCAAGGGTRHVEAVEGSVGYSKDSEGAVSGTVGGKIYFRDARDVGEGKNIKTLSLRTGVLDEAANLGAPLCIPFRLDLSTVDDQAEDVIHSPDGIARIVPRLEWLALAGLAKGGL